MRARHRKHQRSIESAVHKLEQQLGRAPQESEIATEMGMTLADYQELLGKVRGTQLVYLEDMSGADGDATSSTATSPTKRPIRWRMLQDQRMREALVEAIKVLPEREQYVMSMYYEHDMNLKEIAAVLEASPSRASASCTASRSRACASSCAPTRAAHANSSRRQSASIRPQRLARAIRSGGRQERDGASGPAAHRHAAPQARKEPLLAVRSL